MAGVTQRLAEEMAGLSHSEIPGAARLQIRRLITDHIGVAMMGWRATGEAYGGYVTDVGGRPEATVLGAGRRVPAELAAGINAQMCRNTDYEETGPGLHAGPVVAMVALAIGERVGASGRAVVSAAALGYELNARFFFAGHRGDVRHLGTVAAGIAGRLLGLDAEGLNRAMSLGWELPGQSLDYQTAKTPKRVSRLGLANLVSARHGVQAALLVQHGLDVPTDELDLLGDRYDLDGLLASGVPFEHTASRLMLKPWPASRFSNGCLQMADAMRHDHRISPDRITRVVLHLPDVYLVPHQSDPAPTDYWQAIYSVEWATAMVLLGVPAGPDWFSVPRLADPVARSLAARVHLVEDREASVQFASRQWLDLPTAIEVHTDTDVYRRRIVHRHVWGTPETPMPDDRFRGKFLRLTAPALGRDVAEALLAQLNDLDEVADVRTVTDHATA